MILAIHKDACSSFLHLLNLYKASKSSLYLTLVKLLNFGDTVKIFENFY